MNIVWVIVKHYRNGDTTIWHQKYDVEEAAENAMFNVVMDNADPEFRYATIERRVYANFID